MISLTDFPGWNCFAILKFQISLLDQILKCLNIDLQSLKHTIRFGNNIKMLNMKIIIWNFWEEEHDDDERW